MRKITLLSLFLSLTLASCLDQETVSTETDNGVTVVTTDNTADTTTTTGTTTTTDTTTNNTTSTLGTGLTCHGSTADGNQSGNTRIHQYEIIMGGGESWVPGLEGTDDLYGDFTSVLEAGLIFPSDDLLRVRFKIKPQPFVPPGETYCKGRAVGQAGDAHKYTKLKFVMHLRDVICSNYNSSGICTAASLGPRYSSQRIDATDQNTCTSIIDIGSSRNTGANIIATTVEVGQVTADSTCQSNGFGCPAEIKVRDASCWQMTMQVATDFTDDFN